MLVNLSQARRFRIDELAFGQRIKPLQPVREAVFIEAEHRAGAALAVGNLAESERLLRLRNSVPEIAHGIEEGVIGQRRLGVPLKLVEVASLPRFDKAQFRQGAVEGVFAEASAAHVGGRDIGAQENLDIPLDGVFGEVAVIGAARLVEHELREVAAREFRRRVAVEHPMPGRAPLLLPENIPVKEPERGGVFEVGVEAGSDEGHAPEFGDGKPGAPAFRFFGEDSGREAPVPDGAHHVLADAERDYRAVFREDFGVFHDGIDAFLQPGMAEDEGFMAGERKARRMRRRLFLAGYRLAHPLYTQWQFELPALKLCEEPFHGQANDRGLADMAFLRGCVEAVVQGGVEINRDRDARPVGFRSGHAAVSQLSHGF